MFAPPKQIGRYEIIREIARSNDVVYEGWDSVSQTRVAVKQLCVPVSSSTKDAQDRQSRFDREARVAKSLAHPNVVAIRDYGEEGGCPFLVMELIEAPTLAKLIEQRGCLESDQVAVIAEQLLKTLEYAHAKGVIHRDIKPQNLFVLPDGSVKLADFGISSVLSESTFAVTGQVLGTLHYLSPEQAYGTRVDARADLWATAVVLFETLTGVRPFEGASMAEILQRIISGQITWPSTMDKNWRRVLERALAKDPASRFQSVREMLVAVRERNKPVAVIKQPVPAPVSAPSQPRLVQPPLAAPIHSKRRSYVPVLLVVALAVVLLVIAQLNSLPRSVPRESALAPSDSSSLPGVDRSAYSVQPDISKPSEQKEVDPAKGSQQQSAPADYPSVASPAGPAEGSVTLPKKKEGVHRPGNGDDDSSDASSPVKNKREQHLVRSGSSYRGSSPAGVVKPAVEVKSAPENGLDRPPKIGRSKESDSIGHSW